MSSGRGKIAARGFSCWSVTPCLSGQLGGELPAVRVVGFTSVAGNVLAVSFGRTTSFDRRGCESPRPNLLAHAGGRGGAWSLSWWLCGSLSLSDSVPAASCILLVGDVRPVTFVSIMRHAQGGDARTRSEEGHETRIVMITYMWRLSSLAARPPHASSPARIKSLLAHKVRYVHPSDDSVVS